MKTFLAFLVAVMLILPTATLAEEISTAARMTGANAQVVLDQLDRNNIALEHATYYSANDRTYADNARLLNETFNGNINTFQTWDSDSIESAKQEYEIQELIIYEGEFSNFYSKDFIKTPYSLEAELPDLYNAIPQFSSSEQINPTEDKSQDKYPLYIIDSPGAGAIEGFTGTDMPSTLSEKGTLLASESVTSRKFISAFLCNLGKQKNLGDTFKSARNSYYDFASPNEYFIGTTELLGLTLKSYHLFGNPLAEISLPNSTLLSFCDNYVQEVVHVDYGAAFSAEENKEVTDKIFFEYSVEQDNEGFTVLNMKGAQYSTTGNQVPIVRIVKEYPPYVVIEGIENVQFDNPSSLSLHLSSVLSDGSKTDYEEVSLVPSYHYEVLQEDNKQKLILDIIPLEEKGNSLFELYREFSFKINMHSKYPLFVKSINIPSQVAVGDSFDIHITTERYEEATDEIVLVNKDNVLKRIIKPEGEITVSLQADSDLSQDFTLFYYEYENESLSTLNNSFNLSFSTNFVRFAIEEDIPVLKNPAETIEFTISNYLNTSYPAQVQARLYPSIKNDRAEEVQRADCEPDASPYISAGYTCDSTKTCDSLECYKLCTRTACSESGNLVFSSNTLPDWGDSDSYGAYEYKGVAQGFTPNSSNSCYVFSFVPSYYGKWDESETPCYNLKRLPTNGQYLYDSHGTSHTDKVYADAIVGFQGNLSSTSWLNSLPDIQTERDASNYQAFVTNSPNQLFFHTYVLNFKEDTADPSGSDAGTFPDLRNVICANEIENNIRYEIACAPSYEYCPPELGALCGINCVGEETAPYVSLGIYGNNYNYLKNVFEEKYPYDDPENIVDQNSYYGKGNVSYEVFEYPVETKQIKAACARQITQGNSNIQEFSQTLTLQPGDNTLQFSLQNLSRYEGEYTLEVFSIVEGLETVHSVFTVRTNSLPVFSAPSLQVIEASSSALLQLGVSDKEGDSLSENFNESVSRINATHILLDSSSFAHGIHTLLAQANDSFSTTSSELSFYINSAPLLQSYVLTEVEGGFGLYDLSFSASDADNDILSPFLFIVSENTSLDIEENSLLTLLDTNRTVQNGNSLSYELPDTQEALSLLTLLRTTGDVSNLSIRINSKQVYSGTYKVPTIEEIEIPSNELRRLQEENAGTFSLSFTWEGTGTLLLEQLSLQTRLGFFADLSDFSGKTIETELYVSDGLSSSSLPLSLAIPDFFFSENVTLGSSLLHPGILEIILHGTEENSSGTLQIGEENSSLLTVPAKGELIYLLEGNFSEIPELYFVSNTLLSSELKGFSLIGRSGSEYLYEVDFQNGDDGALVLDLFLGGDSHSFVFEKSEGKVVLLTADENNASLTYSSYGVE